MVREYRFFAFLDPDEAGGFCVTFPDLPGAISEGDDLEEALSMAKDCLLVHLSGMLRDGDEIPAPSGREELEERISKDPDVSNGWRLELIKVNA